MRGLDDTLARKRGVKMFGTGSAALPSQPGDHQLGTPLGHAGRDRRIAVSAGTARLPADLVPLLPEQLFRWSWNKKSAAKQRRACRTRPELAVEMLKRLCQHRHSRHFHLVAHSTYGGQSVPRCLPTNCDLTSRLVKDARLQAARPERPRGTNSRPRQRGERLPTPLAMLAGRSPRVIWEIYGRREQARLTNQVAPVCAASERPLHVVATEAVQGGRGPEAFDSTCSAATAEQVLGWYEMRWSIEVMNHDSKQHPGFEEPQG